MSSDYLIQWWNDTKGRIHFLILNKRFKEVKVITRNKNGMGNSEPCPQVDSNNEDVDVMKGSLL